MWPFSPVSTRLPALTAHYPHTRTRLFFRSSPHPTPPSFILSAYSTQKDMVHLCANVVILLVLIVPKMPALEGVRLFGVNKGPEE